MNRVYAPIWIQVVGVVSLVVSMVMGRLMGAAHFLLGLVSTAFFLFVTWKAVQFFGAMVGQGAKPAPSLLSFFIVLGIKVPFIVGLSFYIQSLELRQQGCFVMGLGLVYSWLIGWALSQSNPSTDSSINGSR